MGEQSSISAILCDQNHFITTFMLVTKLILLTKIILVTKIFAPSYRNDSHISFRRDRWRGHIDRTVICHIDTKIIHHSLCPPCLSVGQYSLKILMEPFFQPTVLCVIRLVLLPFVRIAHKTAGTPQAKKRLSMINLWDFISMRESFFIISKI